jgi:hypothetical protein
VQGRFDPYTHIHLTGNMGVVKTTIEISDSLLDEAKRLAAERSTTLRQIVEEGLRTVVEAKPAMSFRLRDGSFGGNRVVRRRKWAEIRDQVYEGRGA